MKHPLSAAILSRYIDNECSSQEVSMIETHCVSCAGCRKALEEMRAADTLAGEHSTVSFSASFDRRFNARLQALRQTRSSNRAMTAIGDMIERMRDVVVRGLSVPIRAVAVVCTIVVVYIASQEMIIIEPSIREMSGSAVIYRQGGAASVAAEQGMRIAKHDVIEVAGGSFVDVSCGEKYTIRVKENSRIVAKRLLPRFGHGTTSYQVESGKALVAINRSFKGSRFIMKTPDAVMRALGTQFVVNVNASGQMTKLGVFEGAVKVGAIFDGRERARDEVVVRQGQATLVERDKQVSGPRDLLPDEWAEMMELYQLDKTRQVALLISTGPGRTRELLKPCPLYIVDKEKGQLGRTLGRITQIINNAIKTQDQKQHLEAISLLEKIVHENPDSEYSPRLLLFIGAYYNHLTMFEKAIEVFAEVADRYPRSAFASMALYAEGIIYDENLIDKEKAKGCYAKVADMYPSSPEAAAIKELNIK